MAPAMGALEIPIGTYHRSESAPEGSLVLNQSIRDGEFSYASEFVPVSLRQRADLQAARRLAPWVWSWDGSHICRHHSSDGP